MSSSRASTVHQMRARGFSDLPSEVRDKIYALAAGDKERLVEKHVSKRNTETTSPAFFAARGYYGLTQVSRQIRQEFRDLYLRDRSISVHIRDAQDYLEAIYPSEKVDRNGIIVWLTIRTDNERRGKYDTPIEIRPLLLNLFNARGIDYEFVGKGGGIFNELFLGYEHEWRNAVENDFKSVELKEASCFGLRIVLNPKSRAPWVKTCAISVTRLPHVPEEALEYFGTLGLNIEDETIFVRRGAPRWMRADFLSGKK